MTFSAVRSALQAEILRILNAQVNPPVAPANLIYENIDIPGMTPSPLEPYCRVLVNTLSFGSGDIAGKSSRAIGEFAFLFYTPRRQGLRAAESFLDLIRCNFSRKALYTEQTGQIVFTAVRVFRTVLNNGQYEDRISVGYSYRTQ